MRVPWWDRSRINTGSGNDAGTCGTTETAAEAGSIAPTLSSGRSLGIEAAFEAGSTAPTLLSGLPQSAEAASDAECAAELASGINTFGATNEAPLLAECTGGLQSSSTRIAAATSLVNLNLGNEISDALDEMFTPLGNSQGYTMDTNGDCLYGADNGMIVPCNDFSADNSDDYYDKKPAAKIIGGAFSPKKEALLIL